MFDLVLVLLWSLVSLCLILGREFILGLTLGLGFILGYTFGLHFVLVSLLYLLLAILWVLDQVSAFLRHARLGQHFTLYIETNLMHSPFRHSPPSILSSQFREDRNSNWMFGFKFWIFPRHFLLKIDKVAPLETYLPSGNSAAMQNQPACQSFYKSGVYSRSGVTLDSPRLQGIYRIVPWNLWDNAQSIVQIDSYLLPKFHFTS